MGGKGAEQRVDSIKGLMRPKDRESELGTQDSPRGFLLCLLQAGNGLRRRTELFLTCKFSTPEVKFRERPGKLSSEASRGKLQGSCYGAEG